MLLRIHDIMTGFSGLRVPGISFYPDRALVLTGIAVVKEGVPGEHIAHLRDTGIGPTTVISVDADGIVDACATDPRLRGIIRDAVRSGARPQFFSTTRHEEVLLEALGLGWTDTFSAPPAIADDACSKAELRRLAVKLGCADSLPHHAICDGRARIYRMIGELLDHDCDFIMLKRSDLASGEGMRRIRKRRDWARYVEKYVEEYGDREVIVEAGYRHEPLSVQWEIEDDGPHFVCATRQYVDGDLAHQGNLLASAEFPELPDEVAVEMRRLSEPFARHYHARGYRGVCGFDCLRTLPGGRVYLLECNGRVTATTYAFGVARQVRERAGAWAVAMANPRVGAGCRTFADVRGRLGTLLFDGKRGVLPFNVRCLALPQPKCTVCCVGRNAADAKELLSAAFRTLA